MVRAGRRGGKTVGAATLAVKRFVEGQRVLYAAPTEDQLTRFWFEVNRALREPIEAGDLYKNENLHVIEKAGTLQRIRAKTAWNADTLRGDYADLLILDEYQLMNEDAWEQVGAPMLLDNNGDAIFIYTPPSVRMRQRSKARDPRHASKLFKRAQVDTSGRWQVFYFSSHDNPFISKEALADITQDMGRLAYEQEILAEDKENVAGALWTQDLIDSLRVDSPPTLTRIVVALDPEATSTEGSAETGIIVAGVGMCNCKGALAKHGFVLADETLRGTPNQWATRAVNAYEEYSADRIVAEDNNGGEMIESTLKTVSRAAAVKRIHASRGKQTRAEPISARYENREVHHVGVFGELEEQMTSWVPGDESPDRMDALVWALTDLLLTSRGGKVVTF